MQQKQSGLSKVEANQLQVRVELQADCFAGVWANKSDQQWQLLRADDIQATMRAIQATSDDTPARRPAGAFSRGTGMQGQRWFQDGLKGGTVGSCNTFRAPTP